jgi:hypothetical protein
MLEEFAYLVNNGAKLQLTPEGGLISPTNEDLYLLIHKQVESSCSPEMSVTNLLTKFFKAELK